MSEVLRHLQVLEQYYGLYNNEELKIKLEKEINMEVAHIESRFSSIFHMLLTESPATYWDRAVFRETYLNFAKLVKEVKVDEFSYREEEFEYFLIGYHAYKQIVKNVKDLRDFNLADDTKVYLYQIPTYTSLLENVISNLLRIICSLETLRGTKDYTNQKSLYNYIDVMNTFGYTKISESIDVNVRNAINHGKVKCLNGDGQKILRFFFTENKINQYKDIKLYEFNAMVDNILDVAGGILLAITLLFNHSVPRFPKFSSKQLQFDMIALELSTPLVVCESINETSMVKQLNVQLNFRYPEMNMVANSVGVVAYIIGKRFKGYDKYMISYSNPRMQTGWMTFTKEEIIDISSDSTLCQGIVEDLVADNRFVYFPCSDEVIDESEYKYFVYPNFITDSYTIKNLAHASLFERKRIKANVFIGDEVNKRKILTIISESIEKLKNVKTPPDPKTPVKHGDMEADSIYLHIFRNDERKNKELYPENENFVCMVDYNLCGETTLKHGSIPEFIWNSLHHEVINKTRIAWREKCYHTVVTIEKIGVNEKCPCGSGKKYKKCCKITNIEWKNKNF